MAVCPKKMARYRAHSSLIATTKACEALDKPMMLGKMRAIAQSSLTMKLLLRKAIPTRAPSCSLTYSKMKEAREINFSDPKRHDYELIL